MKKVTINSIKNAKNKQVLTMLTAYDYLFAKLFDGKVDMILVGDSLNMSFNGQKDTLSATLDMMIYHTKAVCNGANSSLVVCDMPFGTYKNKKVALENAIRVYQETSADAIKIEGGKEKANIVKHLTDNSIAVMGHIGLLPQFFRGEGGYKIKGKDEDSAQKLIEDAQAIQEAGAFAIVCEGVKSDVAKQIAQSVDVPIIGIGAGNGVDGQVLVYSDMLGFFEDFRPKFVKEYLNGAKLIKNSVDNFVNDVQDRSFPSKEESY
jgi:3-methyl-2-oxobutanoate hydroxymethyltransferase